MKLRRESFVIGAGSSRFHEICALAYPSQFGQIDPGQQVIMEGASKLLKSQRLQRLTVAEKRSASGNRRHFQI